MASVTLSSSAAERVATIAARQGAPAMLRLSVEGGGCAGFQYKFGLETALEDDDIVTETDGVKLIVDMVSLDLLDGSEVDFVSNLGGASFQVKNPQAASGCGCGTSFSV
ncbi:iron-sulfur cluster assembly accessory protein [Pacificimonas sp. WHA3]|uniref:Iron-sulfur cluster assembly accessory protein n=1 Tax=Pacificimonas pallii TaxID=2827236 RepID=A0ABS6SGU9_9SPHN|nr:iron-sulfur cluster assembly accessory protein [Pacificimonas pallii]MBV7257645.1 iron-sulfur cluster assembly accessory protein [Pacificimonas pallii]